MRLTARGLAAVLAVAGAIILAGVIGVAVHHSPARPSRAEPATTTSTTASASNTAGPTTTAGPAATATPTTGGTAGASPASSTTIATSATAPGASPPPLAETGGRPETTAGVILALFALAAGLLRRRATTR